MSEAERAASDAEIARSLAAAWDFSQAQTERPAGLGTDEDLRRYMAAVLEKCLRHERRAIQRGWRIFLREDRTGVARRVYDRLQRLAREGAAPEGGRLCEDEAWEHLLGLAADAFDRGGDREDAVCLYSCLQALRPDEPQPYIRLFTVVWERAGIQAAAACYRGLAPFIVSPTYCYYAADCFENAGRLAEARDAVETGIEYLEDPELGFEADPAVARGLYAFRRRLQTAPSGPWEAV